MWNDAQSFEQHGVDAFEGEVSVADVEFVAFAYGGQPLLDHVVQKDVAENVTSRRQKEQQADETCCYAENALLFHL